MSIPFPKRDLIRLLLACLPILAASCGRSDTVKDEYNWYRGNLHTHTFWEGGRDFPENVAKWYRDNHYDFVGFTEHNTLQMGEKWKEFPENHPELLKYRKNFGEEWLDVRANTMKDGYVDVRLKALDEYRTIFEDSAKFLLMNGTEITNKHGVHLLANHVDELIPAVTGTAETRVAMIRETVKSVDAFRKRSGRNVYPILCHPNWGLPITAEMILQVPDLRFFEVYNGVPEANNDGDEHRASTDRIWDIVLTHRLAVDNSGPIYGLACDDAHDYNGGIDGRNVGPGKGWVMVRSRSLEADSIVSGLAKGDFYASTGVILDDIKFNGESIRIEVREKAGEKYLTEYIGTRSGFDTTSVATIGADGKVIPNTTRTYSDEIGEVFSTSESPSSSYHFAGDELYVRVRITSTAEQIDPFTGKVIGIQRAWVQPHLP